MKLPHKIFLDRMGLGDYYIVPDYIWGFYLHPAGSFVILILTKCNYHNVNKYIFKN